MQSLAAISLAFLLFEPVVMAGVTINYFDLRPSQNLTLGRTITREITVGDSHSYEIALSSNQLLCLLFGKRDIEVSIAFLGPSHHKILELRNRFTDSTPVWFISSQPGTYTIEIRPLENNRSKGYYELTARELRDATAQDINLIAAQKALTEAEELRAGWKSDSLTQAIRKYGEAIKYWEEAGNREAEANTLINIGEVYLLLDQNQKALPYFSQVLLLSKSLNNRQMEVNALNYIGETNIDLDNTSITLDYCSKALGISKEIGYVRGQAQALSNLGLNSYALSNLPEALDTLNQALSLWSSIGDRWGQARTLLNIGHTYTDLGRIQEAISSYSQSLPLWQEIKQLQGQAQALTALGLAYSSMGEMQSALDHHDEAAKIFKLMGNRVGEAVTLNARAYVYDTLGEKHRALAYYERAMQLYRVSGRRSSESITMGLIGEIYHSLGNEQKAIEYYNRKIAISRALKDLRAEAYTLKDLGAVFDSQGDRNKALDHYNRALSLSQRLHDPRCEAYVLNGIGYVYDELGQKQKALEFYKRSLKLLQIAKDHAMEILALRNVARVMSDLGNLDGAYDHCKVLLQLMETVRAKVASHELRVSYFASTRQHYELYVDVLMLMHKQNPAAGHDIVALEASEKARARSMIDLLNEARANIRQGVDPDLLGREREIRQLLKTKAMYQIQLLNGDHSEKQATTVADELSTLTNDYDQVWAQIRRNSPHYAALAQQQTLTLPEIQQDILDPDTLLLEYLLGDKRSYLWAVTPTGISSFELPGRAKIEDLVRQMYKLASSPIRSSKDARWSEIAAQLSKILLEPVSDHLGKKRLIIVADGALQYLPFGALSDPASAGRNYEGAQPIIVNHEVVSLPSASTLGVLRKEITGRSPAPKTIAVLADPVFEKTDPRVYQNVKKYKMNQKREYRVSGGRSGRDLLRSGEESGALKESYNFQRLPYASQDATTIASLVPDDQCKLAKGFEASYSTATSPELSQYRIVHFATHGLLNSLHPQLSGIVLSLVDERGNSQDGFLRLNDIYNLNLPAELVVLSACQTALGKDVKGEGLIGLTRGFIYAGAAGVIASLWKVDDKATAEFMKLFYTGLLGQQQLRPAAALRAAQVAMRKQDRWNPPFYWSAFVLVGEWK